MHIWLAVPCGKVSEYRGCRSRGHRVIRDGEAPLVASMDAASSGKVDSVVDAVKNDIHLNVDRRPVMKADPGPLKLDGEPADGPG